MRRVAVALGTLVTPGTVAAALPASAQAASGVLIINGGADYDPRGCYDSTPAGDPG